MAPGCCRDRFYWQTASLDAVKNNMLAAEWLLDAALDAIKSKMLGPEWLLGVTGTGFRLLTAGKRQLWTPVKAACCGRNSFWVLPGQVL